MCEKTLFFCENISIKTNVLKKENPKLFTNYILLLWNVSFSGAKVRCARSRASAILFRFRHGIETNYRLVQFISIFFIFFKRELIDSRLFFLMFLTHPCVKKTFFLWKHFNKNTRLLFICHFDVALLWKFAMYRSFLSRSSVYYMHYRAIHTQSNKAPFAIDKDPL